MKNKPPKKGRKRLSKAEAKALDKEFGPIIKAVQKMCPNCKKPHRPVGS